MVVRLTGLNPGMWLKNGANLERLGIFNEQNAGVFLINPAQISALGGTKSSQLSDSNFLSLRMSPSFDISASASAHLNSAWAANGWTVGDREVFLSELAAWCTNHFEVTAINQDLSDVDLILMQGNVSNDSENSYTVALAYFGNKGLEINLQPGEELVDENYGNLATASGVITLAGDGTFDQQDGIGTAASLSKANCAMLRPDGKIAFWDSNMDWDNTSVKLRTFNPANNQVSTVCSLTSGNPYVVASVMDSNGNVFFTDNSDIFRLDKDTLEVVSLYNDTWPSVMGMHPLTGDVYFFDWNDSANRSRLRKLKASNGWAVETVINSFGGPDTQVWGCAFTSTGDLYIAETDLISLQWGGRISKIVGSTRTVLKTINTDWEGISLVMSPDEADVYISDYFSCTIDKYNIATNTLSDFAGLTGANADAGARADGSLAAAVLGKMEQALVIKNGILYFVDNENGSGGLVRKIS